MTSPRGRPTVHTPIVVGDVFEAPDGTIREVVGIDDQGRLLVRTLKAIEPGNLALWIRRTCAITVQMHLTSHQTYK